MDKSKGGTLVKRQVPRKNLAPLGVYTWTILSRFKQLENQYPELIRKDLQAQVHEYLSDAGLFEVYPSDNTATKNGQPRWKQRFSAALAHLKKNGCIEELEKVNPQQIWSGVKYRGLEKGLDILWEVNFHIDCDPGGHAYLCSWDSPSEDSLGIRMCPKPLEPREIPHELEGNKFRGTA